MDHPTATGLLAALVAGDLEESQARELSAHAENCDECTGVLATLAEVADAGRTVDPALFDDHPPSESLARLAASPGDDDAETVRVRAHVDACPTCSHELAVTRAALRTAASPRSVRRPRWRPQGVPLALAAVLVVMLIPATVGIRQLLRPTAPVGAVRTYVVASQVRDDAATRLSIDRSQPVVLLVFDRAGIEPPAGAMETRVALRRPDGTEMWSTSGRTDAILVPGDPTLSLLIPTRALREGTYNLELSWPPGPAASRVAEFRILP